MKWTIIIAGILLVLATVFVLYGSRNLSEAPVVDTGGDAAAIMTYDNASSDDIIITSPTAGAEIMGTFILSGEARGNWYFEASFPVEVIAEDGTSLALLPIQAQGEWMTTDFVPFSTEITIEGDYTGPATIVVHKDNPSGLPEHDGSVSIPVVIVAPGDAMSVDETSDVMASTSLEVTQ